mgnify:CR=1 FL=1
MEEQINLDDSFNIPLVEEPKITPKAKKEEVTSTTTREEKELVNCLRKEIITVRYLPKASGIWGNNPKHVLSGGMAENATRTFVVPKLSSGIYVNVLTDSEKAYLEEILDLEPNALSIYKKKDNFWSDSNPEGIKTAEGEIVHTVYVEMKNKHNTMNSSAAAKTYIKCQSQLLEDDDCVCCLVEAIAKHSQDIKWVASVDGKRVQHKRIRRMSMDRFYELVTGQTDAFYQMCLVLPNAIEKVIANAEIAIPHDTVIEELRTIASEKKISMAMAIYLLGFSEYNGFYNK